MPIVMDRNTESVLSYNRVTIRRLQCYPVCVFNSDAMYRMCNDWIQSSISEGYLSIHSNLSIIHMVTLELSFSKSGGVHDSYTFQCRLVGSFTFPGIDTR